MNIVGEQGSLSCRFPPPKSRNIHCKFSDRLIFRQAEHMTKEPQLPKPDSFNKGRCFCKKHPNLNLVRVLLFARAEVEIGNSVLLRTRMLFGHGQATIK